MHDALLTAAGRPGMERPGERHPAQTLRSGTDETWRRRCTGRGRPLPTRGVGTGTGRRRTPKTRSGYPDLPIQAP